MRRFLPLCLALGCAGAPPKPTVDPDGLRELRSQLDAQSALVQQQQRRIEELEVKLAALVARSQPAAPARTTAPAAAPAKEPRPPLKTVKLGEGRRLHRSDRVNPVERAPRLPATVELREPDEDQLARLEADPVAVQEFDADHAWAEAVQKLNDGHHAEAESDFLAFVAAHPRHTAADNALYLAGLVREARGDCAGALQLFESVPAKYPAGDAVPQALLERGRCLRTIGKRGEAKAILMQLEQDHPEAPETAFARQLLQDL
ncbi:MAG: tetratricopeptide repeat protein [Myxococcales bacterium]